jgi:hypothetical protein
VISVIESYANIVRSYRVERFREFGGAHQFVAIVELVDDSTLHIRDYLFLDGTRKYSYHWQDKAEKLIMRWDNSEHHRHLSTFPFHQHTSNVVEESVPMNVEKVLQFISKKLSGE